MADAPPPMWRPQPGAVGLAKGGGLAMLAVRVATFSRYSHVAVCEAVDAGGRITVIEPMPKGCRRRQANVGEFVWSDVPLTVEQQTIVVEYARSCVGVPYDWPAIFGFILRVWGFKVGVRPDSDPRSGVKLMCVEMAVRAWRMAGLTIVPVRPASAVSAGHLRQWLDDRTRATRRP